jgi:hypothetical protein
MLCCTVWDSLRKVCSRPCSHLIRCLLLATDPPPPVICSRIFSATAVNRSPSPVYEQSLLTLDVAVSLITTNCFLLLAARLFESLVPIYVTLRLLAIIVQAFLTAACVLITCIFLRRVLLNSSELFRYQRRTCNFSDCRFGPRAMRLYLASTSHVS